METRFKKRFKSSIMKITKNSSIYDKLVPIEKSINPSQIHNDISIKSKLAKFKAVNNSTELEYGVHFPQITSPESPLHNSGLTAANSRLKINKSVTPRYNQSGNLVKLYSPNNIKVKSDRDKYFNHMKHFEQKSEFDFTSISNKTIVFGRRKLLRKIDRIP